MISTTTRRLLAAAGVGTALAVSLAGTAVADTATGGRTNGATNVVRGAGSGTGSFTATPSGAITVDARSTGGDGLGLPIPLPIPLPGFGATTTGTQVNVANAFEAYAGTHRVTVTYQGASSQRSTTGSKASGYAQRTSSAVFACQSGCEDVADHPLIKFESMPGAQQTVTTSFVVAVPEGEAGAISVSANVLASATADGRGNSARTQAATTGIVFDVTRI